MAHLLNTLKDGKLVEAGEDHHGHAGGEGLVDQGHEAKDVAHGQDAKNGVRARVQVRVTGGDALDLAGHVVVRAHDTLGQAGRARRVAQPGGRVSLVAVKLLRAAGAVHDLVDGAVLARAAEEDDVLVLEAVLEERTRLLEDGEEQGREEDGLGARVVELVRELLGAVRDVGGRDSHAGSLEAPGADNPVEAVGTKEEGHVAALDVALLEAAGEALGALLELAALELAPGHAVDVRDELGVARLLGDGAVARLLREQVAEDVDARELGLGDVRGVDRHGGRKVGRGGVGKGVEDVCG
jgi:hypothetical protein